MTPAIRGSGAMDYGGDDLHDAHAERLGIAGTGAEHLGGST
jgi:hypothetical protein